MKITRNRLGACPIVHCPIMVSKKQKKVPDGLFSFPPTLHSCHCGFWVTWSHKSHAYQPRNHRKKCLENRSTHLFFKISPLQKYEWDIPEKIGCSRILFSKSKRSKRLANMKHETNEMFTRADHYNYITITSKLNAVTTRYVIDPGNAIVHV